MAVRGKAPRARVTLGKVPRGIPRKAPFRDAALSLAYDQFNELLEPPDRGAPEFHVCRAYRASCGTLGRYAVLTETHRHALRNVVKDVRSYCNDHTRRRPFSVVLTAEPGLGKSYFAESLAKEMRELNDSYVSFNLANMQAFRDLGPTIDAVRNHRAKSLVPLLFLDEFDCEPPPTEPKDLELLMPLIGQGEVHLGGRPLRLGKCVILLAGSSDWIKEEFERHGETPKDVKEKLGKRLDFLSRVNGGWIHIPGLDDQLERGHRKVDKACIFLAVLRARFGDELMRVPWALLSFVVETRFVYSVRSIEFLVDAIAPKAMVGHTLQLDSLGLPLGDWKVLEVHPIWRHFAEIDPKDPVARWQGKSATRTMVRFGHHNC